MEDGIFESWAETKTQAFKLVNTKTKNKTCQQETEQGKNKFRLLAELPGEKARVYGYLPSLDCQPCLFFLFLPFSSTFLQLSLLHLTEEAGLITFLAHLAVLIELRQHYLAKSISL